MLVLALAVVVAVLVVGLGSLLLGRPRQDDEVERFHRARRMTTEWARSGVTRPNLVEDAVLPDPPHESAPAYENDPAYQREPADVS